MLNACTALRNDIISDEKTGNKYINQETGICVHWAHSHEQNLVLTFSSMKKGRRHSRKVAGNIPPQDTGHIDPQHLQGRRYSSEVAGNIPPQDTGHIDPQHLQGRRYSSEVAGNIPPQDTGHIDPQHLQGRRHSREVAGNIPPQDTRHIDLQHLHMEHYHPRQVEQVQNYQHSKYNENGYAQNHIDPLSRMLYGRDPRNQSNFENRSHLPPSRGFPDNPKTNSEHQNYRIHYPHQSEQPHNNMKHQRYISERYPANLDTPASHQSIPAMQGIYNQRKSEFPEPRIPQGPQALPEDPAFYKHSAPHEEQTINHEPAPPQEDQTKFREDPLDSQTHLVTHRNSYHGHAEEGQPSAIVREHPGRQRPVTHDISENFECLNIGKSSQKLPEYSVSNRENLKTRNSVPEYSVTNIENFKDHNLQPFSYLDPQCTKVGSYRKNAITENSQNIPRQNNSQNHIKFPRSQSFQRHPTVQDRNIQRPTTTQDIRVPKSTVAQDTRIPRTTLAQDTRLHNDEDWHNLEEKRKLNKERSKLPQVDYKPINKQKKQGKPYIPKPDYTWHRNSMPNLDDYDG
ncbi:hypothetical protein SK128_027188 [Halocaridina rubra]|uniref:Uncharacterized protein n=1 Tax=Halocaridina rubra TaxID=373956 RepID=A0AAN8X1K5_HALRR